MHAESGVCCVSVGEAVETCVKPKQTYERGSVHQARVRGSCRNANSCFHCRLSYLPPISIHSPIPKIANMRHHIQSSTTQCVDIQPTQPTK